jgi:hypothetical protein
VAGVFFLLFFAAAAPSLLYGVYRAQWRFSAVTLTAVFAVYALLLLVFGSVSDYLGRRPLILAGLAMTAGACGLFLAARGVGLLFAARALHGAAVGTASSALGAALIDLQPEGSGIAPVVTTGVEVFVQVGRRSAPSSPSGSGTASSRTSRRARPKELASQPPASARRDVTAGGSSNRRSSPTLTPRRRSRRRRSSGRCSP